MSRGTRRPKQRNKILTQDFPWERRADVIEAVGPITDPTRKLCKLCWFEARNGHAPGCSGEEKE